MAQRDGNEIMIGVLVSHPSAGGSRAEHLLYSAIIKGSQELFDEAVRHSGYKNITKKVIMLALDMAQRDGNEIMIGRLKNHPNYRIQNNVTVGNFTVPAPGARIGPEVSCCLIQ